MEQRSGKPADALQCVEIRVFNCPGSSPIAAPASAPATDSTTAPTTNESFYYGAEPFSTFQHKVLELCCSRFPNVCPSNIHIERVNGGSFNRVVAITVTASEGSKWSTAWIRQYVNYFRHGIIEQPEKRYILRIPRSCWRDSSAMEYDVAALRFAGRALKFPIPKIEHFDGSKENALGTQYMIQERLPGRRLDEVWEELTFEHKKSVVRAVISFHKETQKITSSTPGIINPVTNSESCLVLTKPTVCSRIGTPTRPPAIPQSTVEYLSDQCQRWIAYEQDEDKSVTPVWYQFLRIIQAMHKRGFLPSNDKFHFCHLDLHPRNILVKVCNDSEVEITGIIDWDADYTAFCPRFIAYNAPFWLWADDDDKTPELRTYNFFDGLTPQDTENKQIKAYFERLAGEEWLRYAYPLEYILARRMVELFRDGFWNSECWYEAEAVVKEWHKLHPSDRVDLESMPISPNVDEANEHVKNNEAS